MRSRSSEGARRGRPRGRRDARVLAALLCLLAGACAATRPSRPNDACAIFDEKPDWYEDARESYETWGVPVPVQLAVIHQESRFTADVRPPRTTLLWVLPGPRPSSAYGYGQVLESTWEEYQEERGGWFADRDDFGDVADFIGWYGARGERRYGIPRDDPYAFYLAYHEGHAGYLRGTYRTKPAVKRRAAEVARRARFYARQLGGCTGG
ncbi:MAG: hypothetical protein AB1689_20070 [Thermodesulfobacteriota bacterium]